MEKQGLDAQGVRDALSVGDIHHANKLMKSVYCIHGLVVHGNHLGRSLGYPTANLELLKNKPFLLANGVYAVKVEVNQLVYNGMANAGIRPTVNGKTLTVEVNLFDFTGDLYGKTLVVYFYHRIRDEKKFESLDHLVRQIHLDKKETLRLLS
ncbi:MAG: riboflavin kinase [Bacteroidales bacterium]|nr:riboflavin kinase [Bacteroidales bacterium]